MDITRRTRVALRRGIEPRTAYEEIYKTLLLTLSEALRRGDKRSSEAAYLLVGLVCEMREGGESNPSNLKS